jgi:hypothetical protein
VGAFVGVVFRCLGLARVHLYNIVTHGVLCYVVKQKRSTTPH